MSGKAPASANALTGKAPSAGASSNAARKATSKGTRALARSGSARPSVSCLQCPLRRHECFTPIGHDELQLIDSLKQADTFHRAGEMVIDEGRQGAGLFTLFGGWAMRFKSLPDGRRQVLNILLPGDFIGLQRRLDDLAEHGVQALTDVHLCALQRDAVWRIHRGAPALGYDLTWVVAREETVVDANLLSAGRRTARERIAALMIGLHARARQVLPADEVDLEVGMVWPLTQQVMADASGLSLIHTHRTLRELQAEGLALWPRPQRLQMPDPARLASIAKLRWPLTLPPRPLI